MNITRVKVPLPCSAARSENALLKAAHNGHWHNARVRLDSDEAWVGDATFAAFCALGGGACAGLAYTCVRELGVMGVRGPAVILSFGVFATLGSLASFAWDPSAMTLPQTLILAGAGIGATVAQFGVTAAYRYAPAKEIAAFDYANIVFTGVLGYAFLYQVPDALSLAGFALIIAAGWRTLRG